MNLRELKWLILFMSGTALALLQTVQYVFLNPGGGLTVLQALLAWVLGISIITFFVHASFRETRKVHDQLVTELVQSNNAQERMKHIVDSTKDAVLTFDEARHYTFVNKSAEELAGFSTPTLLKMNVKEMERIREEKEHQLEVIAKLGQLILETKEETPFSEILEVLGRFSASQRAFAVLGDNGNSHKGIIQQSYEWCRECDPHTKDGVASSADLSANSDASTCLSIPPTLTLPLIVGDSQVGIIGVEKSTAKGSWSTITTQLLAIAATMISQAVERQKTNLEIKGHFQSLAGTLCRTIRYIDPYTATHQERLAILAQMLGERMEMDKERLAWLHLGGLMHDIGKMAVPSTILSKPGRLTDEEWVLLRSHPRRGYELLDNMNLPDFVTDMVLHHHERLDGSGYPSGMRGNEITREVRILGACDVVEAMISHRPYRPARSEAEMIDELSKGKGTKYDLQIVDMLVDIFQSGEFEQKFSRDYIPFVEWPPTLLS